jgi:hypothetical protein
VTQIDKLIEKLRSKPKSFKYSDLQKVMTHFGYIEDNAGKTSGSVVSFVDDDRSITIHRPHPSDEVAQWALKKVVAFLKEEGKF